MEGPPLRLHPFLPAGASSVDERVTLSTFDSAASGSLRLYAHFAQWHRRTPAGTGIALIILVGEYRGYVHRTPDFDPASLNTNAWTHTVQPSGDIVFRFQAEQ